MLGQALGERDTALNPADRGQADHDRRPPAHVPVPLLTPGAGDDRRNDREQRGRLGVELREPEPQRERCSEPGDGLAIQAPSIMSKSNFCRRRWYCTSSTNRTRASTPIRFRLSA